MAGSKSTTASEHPDWHLVRTRYRKLRDRENMRMAERMEDWDDAEFRRVGRFVILRALCFGVLIGSVTFLILHLASGYCQ